MNKEISLLEFIQDKVDKKKGITFISDENQEEFLSYPELLIRAQNVLFALQAKGDGCCSHVIFQVNDNKSFIIIFWACLLGRIIPVPVTVGYSDESKAKLIKIYDQLNNPFLVTEQEPFDSLQEYLRTNADAAHAEKISERVLFVNELWKNKKNGVVYPPGPHDVAFIQFSSGSTGTPRGVVLTHENLLTNIDAILSGINCTENDSCLSWMPLTHDMGLIGFHLAAVGAGINQFLMPTSLFMQRPDLWFIKASQHKVNILSSPNFGYKYFLKSYAPGKMKDVDLSPVRLIFNGAEPISYDLALVFLNTLSAYHLKKNVMFPVYGLAEASLAVTFPPAGEELIPVKLERGQAGTGDTVKQITDGRDGLSFVDVGFPVKGCQVRICSNDNEVFGENRIGSIQIKGKNVTRGYYNIDPQDLFSPDGWLKTGDIGFIHNNRLVVTGREKDIIFVNGRNFYSHDIEEAVLTMPGINLMMAAACGIYDKKDEAEKIFVFILYKRKLESFVAKIPQIKKYLHQKLGIETSEIIPVKKIPVTTSGKVQRYKLVEEYRNGDFLETISKLEELAASVLNMTDNGSLLDDVGRRVLLIVQEILGLKRIESGLNFFEQGADSLKIFMLLSQVNARFNVNLSFRQVWENPSISGLAEIIKKSIASDFVPVPSVGNMSFYPLSSAQKRLFLLSESREPDIDYNLPGAMVIEGNLDVQRFLQTFKKIIERHEVLRTSFIIKDGEPVQIIHENPPWELDYQDMLDSPVNVRREYRNFIRPFLLSESPLLRVRLIKISSNEHLFLFDIHHIISDGISINILINEFTSIYDFPDIQLPPLKIQYKDYAAWHNKQQEVEKLEAKEFWMNEFKGEIPVLNLPVDFPRSKDQLKTGCKINFQVNPVLTLKLKELALSGNSSLFIVLLSIYNVLLLFYTGQEDIITGIPSAGRNHPDLDGIMGMFVNTLPVRNFPRKDMRFHDFVCEVRDKALAIYGYQDYPFEKITESLSLKRGWAMDSLFSTMFTLQDTSRITFNTRDLVFKALDFENPTAKYDLTFFSWEKDNHIVFEVEYNSSLFNEHTVTKLGERFIKIIEAVTIDPSVVLFDIDLVSPAEQEFLRNLNRTKSSYPFDKTIPELFAEQVSRLPDQCALVFEDKKMSYRQLDEKTDQLAAFLINRNFGRGKTAALLLDRSFEMIICILGVLKAGGTYLPLDTAYPPNRLSGILAGSGAFLVLASAAFEKTTAQATHRIAEENPGPGILFIESILDSRKEEPLVRNTCLSSDIAYIMYTSGSSGIPKGNLATHFNITRVVKNTNYIDINEHDRLIQLSNYAFDGSTFDIFGALLNGASLILTRKEILLDVYSLSALINREKITLFFITTALFNTLVDLDLQALKNTRKILFGGERVSLEHVKKAFGFLGKDHILHVYGPTESTVFATFYPINEIKKDAVTIPIGKPLSNTEIYVTNSRGRILPPGIPGELCIGGDGLITGYFNSPELTAEKFVVSHFCGDKRIYKSGDLVRLLPGGDIEFIDRIDSQIKLRGFRIEPGEIESTLLKHDLIKEAVVIPHKEQSGMQYLCAYFVSNDDLSSKRIIEFLKLSLPDYMIPSVFMRLDKMPLNLNGKIDKKALPVPVSKIVDDDYEKPADPLEQKLYDMCLKILNMDFIGVNSDFFNLGVNSLKVMTIVSEIRKSFQINITFIDIYSYSTIKDLAAYIKQSEKDERYIILPAAAAAFYPVTSGQKRLYILQKYKGINTAYNIPIGIRIQGRADRQLLEKSFKEIIRRHEILRTSFDFINGEIVQRIADNAAFVIHDTEESLSDCILPFVLDAAPLLRVYLKQTGEKECLLLLDIHHIAADGISINILLDEFKQLYTGKFLPALPLQYKDYAVWLDHFLRSGALGAQKEFWLQCFQEEPPALINFNDYPHANEKNYHGATHSYLIPCTMVGKIDNAAKQYKVTMNSILFAAYALFLHKYSGEMDIVIGSLTAGRNFPGTENLIGMFNNFLPVRINLNIDDPASQFIIHTNKILIDALGNQDYPYDKIIEDLSFSFDESRNPLFDTMLIFHEEIEVRGNFLVNDLELSHFPMENRSAKLDLKLDIYRQEDDALGGYFEYNTSLFKKETIERMSRHFVQILTDVIENPGQKISQINLLTAEEKRQILLEFNNTEIDFPAHMTMHGIFEENAEKHPDRIAVIYEEKRLTYNMLNQKANSAAHYLKKQGISRNCVVCLFLERSVEMMIGILAVLKAGGAYLPVSPEYPQERINFILSDSQSKLILSTSKPAGSIEFGCPVVMLDDEGLYAGDLSNPQPESGPGDLVYVIYTSGSTGNPKGAMIEHQSLVNRLNWMQRQYPIGENDVILQKTPYTFDVSAWELFWWMLSGSTVVFLKPGGERYPDMILDAVNDNRVTFMHFVPSMLNPFLDYVERTQSHEKASSLKRVFCSGEALTVPHVKNFNKVLGVNTKLSNLYGPTEACVDVSYYDCPGEDEIEKVPIGRPIDNIKLYVLDKSLNLQPVGVAGELYIAGIGVGRGYLNRDELTKEKFIDDPVTGKGRMYKTGDLCRWLDDGNIEYLGRIDFQVKLRGFRIELGEIESALLKHPLISDCVVMLREEKGGDKYLCAYVVNRQEITEETLKDYLCNLMPLYMVPSYFVFMQTLPLSLNGKINRKELPQPIRQNTHELSSRLPSDDVESKIASIWCEILGRQSVSVDESFFNSGGNSLSAISLCTSLIKELNISLPLEEIFKQKSIRNLASFIKKAGQSEYLGIEKIEYRKYYPVSSAQKRLFILDKIIKNSTAYNLTGALSITGNIDYIHMESVFIKLILRHEILRTSFCLIDGEVFQQVHEDFMFAIKLLDDDQMEPQGMIISVINSFDLSQSPLLRVFLFKMDTKNHLLVFDLHHIAADGISLVILVKEFNLLYKEESLPELKIQYKDYASWQNKQLLTSRIKKQEEYWRNKFSDEIPVLNLPVDFIRPMEMNYEGSRLSFVIEKEIVHGLHQLTTKLDATLYMVLLGFYFILLNKYSGQEDIIVGSPTSGRVHADLANSVGMFVNTLVLRCKLESSFSFNDFISCVKRITMEALENQEYQFEDLVEILEIPRELNRNPLFDTMFVFQNMGIPFLEIEELRFEPVQIIPRVVKFDLTMEIVENNDGLVVNLDYSTELFKKETIERMSRHFVQILTDVIENPGQKISQINLLTAEEKRQILLEFNNTEIDFPAHMTMHGIFEKNAEKHPDRIAVIYEEKRLTYNMLNQKANSAAHYLRKQGISRDCVVCLFLERSVEMMIGILAVLKAGGAYLPVSPEYPQERINFILSDSRAKLILSTSKLAVRIEFGCPVVMLDDEGLYASDLSNPQQESGPGDLVYVIYTSGSTGNPKGAMIEHQSLVNRLNWMQRQYPIRENDVILQKTPYTFDVSAWELFWWMLSGSSVVFLKPGGERYPDMILDAVNDNCVTVMHFVPSMLNPFLDYIERTQNHKKALSLKRVFCSGEALTVPHVKNFNKVLGANTKLSNLYGPTEACVDVSYYDCPGDVEIEKVPIGRPIDNIKLYVLDKSLNLQPVGVAGELYIAGIGVGRGYLNRGELTKEKFIHDPVTGRGRMYKTGDLCRWLDDGNIEYLGRIDFQVKLRGFRIELGEIESALLKHPLISDCVVMLREEKERDKYLCAYVVNRQEITEETLKDYLGSLMPLYMVPSYFVFMQTLPLSLNGKINRKELPQPNCQNTHKLSSRLPSDDVESKIASIWCEILGRQSVSVDESFFNSGGNSLLLLQLHEKIDLLYPSQFQVVDLFSNPTVRKMGSFIKNKDSYGYQNWKGNFINLPQDYFKYTGDSLPAKHFYYHVEPFMEEKIMSIVDKEQIEPIDVFIGAFIYLFAQLIRKYDVGIQVLTDKKNSILNIKTNLKEYIDITGLYKQINYDRNNSLEILQADLFMSIIIEKKTNTVLPLFYNHTSYTLSKNLLDTFDIIIEYKLTEQGIILSLEYNNTRLNYNKIKDFFNKYIELLKLLINK